MKCSSSSLVVVRRMLLLSGRPIDLPASIIVFSEKTLELAKKYIESKGAETPNERMEQIYRAHIDVMKVSSAKNAFECFRHYIFPKITCVGIFCSAPNVFYSTWNWI